MTDRNTNDITKAKIFYDYAVYNYTYNTLKY